MYTLKVPFKDFRGKARNMEAHFNLTEPEIFKLMIEFKTVFNWRDQMKGEDVRDLDPAEVVEFFTAFEQILLSAWGVPSEDGLYFRKAGRYEYEESAQHAAVMVMMVTDVAETNKLVDGIMPDGMEDMIKKADDNLAAAAKNLEPDAQAEIARLRAQLAAQEGGTTDS